MSEAYPESFDNGKESRNPDFTPLSVDDTAWLAELGPPREAMTDEWLEGMSIAAEQGAKHINPLHMSYGEIHAISSSRRYFYNVLGLDDEDHELHAAYRTIKADRPHDISTQSFIGVARLLHGKGVSVSKVFKNAPTFFWHTPRSAGMKVSYLEKMAAKLSWDGDLAELIERDPAFLTHSRQRLGVVARMITMTETPAEMPSPQEMAVLTKRVGRLGLDTYVHASLTGRFTKITEPPTGTRGQTVHGRKLGRSRVIRLAGQRAFKEEQRGPEQALLSEYFRYKPPTAKEIEWYPGLTRYLRKKQEVKTQPDDLSLTAEDWLWLSHFGEFTDHTQLNRLLRAGSRSRLVQAGDYESEKTQIQKARQQFLRTLADNSKDTRLKESLDRYFSQKRRLPVTYTAVEAFRVLAEAGINVAEVLARYPAMLTTSKEKLEEVFGVFKEYGVDPVKVALRTPVLLGFSVETLGHRLEFLNSHGFRGEVIEQRPTLLKYKPDQVLALLT